MPRVDLEKLRILSRFVGGVSPPRPIGPSEEDTFPIDRGPSEPAGAPLARVDVAELCAMLDDRVEVEAVLEVLAEEGTRASVEHILPILIEGTASERSAARRALEAIAGRLGDDDAGGSHLPLRSPNSES